MSKISDIFNNQSRINFVPIWRKALIVSSVLLLISVGSLFVRGLNLGIEFEGGASWEVASSTVEIDDLRQALEPFGYQDARIQRVANDLYRVRAETDSTATLEAVKSALAEAAGVQHNDVTANAVGASWGSEITAKARTALIVFFIVLFLYITIRLEWKMAVGALAAVAHDILICIGFYALFQFEVTSATVIAFLTILGYSLYDTLVVFDKVRDNERRAAGTTGTTYSSVASFSMNQVLMRSINTTVTSVLPVASVLLVGRFVLGAVSLQEFSLALLIGLIAGGYSSIFIATPIVAWLKEREADNVERQLAAEKKGEVDDLGAVLNQADRARRVRSSARSEGVRVRGATESGGVKVTKRSGSGTVRTASGEIKPRPRKNK